MRIENTISRRKPGNSRRRRAPLLVAAAIAALALLVFALALLLRSGPRSAGVAPEPERTPAPIVAAPVVEPSTGVQEAQERERTNAPESTPPAAPPRGTLVVVLSGLPEGSALATDVWVSERRTHAGAPLAIRTRTSVPPGLGRAELLLPGGSFSVRAQAPGWTSAARRVDLDVRSPHAQVELHLAPCAGARGVLLRHDGSPAADVAAHVVDAEGQWLASARTGHDGAYAFDCVPPVAGRLVIGSLAGPLTAPIDVDLSVQLLRVPDVSLPPMGRIAIVVRDEFGVAVPDVALEGLSDASVRLELASDARGLAACEHVPPGTWRIFGDAGALGRGNVAFEVAAGAESRVELRLRP